MKLAQRYLYPPRPNEGSIAFEDTGDLARYGYQAQLKYNDKRLLISINNGDITLFNRHNSVHKTYQAPADLRREILQVCAILGLDLGDWQYIDGGLLHGKHRFFSNTIVIWDILVRNGEWLRGTTYQERYQWLLGKIPNPQPYVVEIGGKKFDIGIKITDHIFIPHMTDDYEAVWKLVHEINEAAGWKNEGEPLLEGIVLKRPGGKLAPGFKPQNNADWQTRCRIETGRHRF
jgi:ATP-dependent DNA ligase